MRADAAQVLGELRDTLALLSALVHNGSPEVPQPTRGLIEAYIHSSIEKIEYLLGE